MPNARFVAVLPQAASASPIADDLTQWIEIMPTVERDRNGPWYWTITPDDLATWADDLAARAGDVAVDYDHAEGSTGTKAAGWFTGETEIRDGDDGSQRLWARVRWTSVAAEEIRDGAWRRISPEMTFASKDPKTGLLTKARQIIAATLTNRPHFKQLSPVASEVVWEAGMGLQELLSRVYQALNPGGFDNAAFWVMDVTNEKALVGEYDGQRHWVVPFEIAASGEIRPAPKSDWTSAEQEWVEAASTALKTTRAQRPFREGAIMHDSLKAIAAEHGLGDDATDEQVIEAVKGAKAKASLVDDLEQKVTDLEAQASAAAGDKTELEQLRADLDAERKLRLEGEIEQVLAKAVTERRIAPAAKEELAKQFGDNVDGLKAVIAAMPEGTFAQRSKSAGDEPDVEGAHMTSGRYESDEDGDAVHAKAIQILGKAEYTEAEYAAAAERAERELAAA